MPTNNHSDNPFDGQPPLDDEQLWDLLSLYVDGEADPEQAAIVERMLSSDPAYRRDFDFLMQSSQTMHMVEEVEPPVSLREAVLSKTTRRPTLVGRLRAAWSRATLPAFGRYATIGGAFAAAALAVVIFWPRPGVSNTTNIVAPSHPVATITHPTNLETATNRTVPPAFDRRINWTSVDDLIKLPTNSTTHKEQAHSTQSEHAKLPIVLDPHKTGVKTGPRVATNTTNQIKPPTHSPQPTHQDQLAINSTFPYSYKPGMENDLAAHRPKAPITTTQGNDFGPTVAKSEDPPTVTPAPDRNPAGTTKLVSDDTPRPAPIVELKKIVHTVMAPDVRQELLERKQKHDTSMQYSSNDSPLADYRVGMVKVGNF